MYKKKKWLAVLVICLILVTVFSITAFAASGDVAGAIENTWNAAKTQIKQVVNNVVFPVIDLILAVLFFAKIAMAYMDYRKHGQFEFTAPAILFACLVFSLSAPLYVWSIIGM
ncbi:MAG: DUF3852 domain-containing protein [Eubacteriales bacterium]|nr:DUF3852 domain-containing protein [Eubacteriales bacterium]